jgi:hypothetical protein
MEYTITRLPEWTDDQWEALIDAIEETVVAVATDWEDAE